MFQRFFISLHKTKVMKTNDSIFDSSRFGLTENGALTHVTTESAIVDQFGKAGNYRHRPIEKAIEDQEDLWKEDPSMATCFPFYLRLITRKAKIGKNKTTENVQNGQGARDESFKRLLSIAKNHKETFEKNVWLLPIVGSWKDIWTLMYYDETQEMNAVDKSLMYYILSQGLSSPIHVDLVKKYMPRIKSNCKLKTPWLQITNKLAKGFANFLHLSYGDYNRLKTSGKAHDFQKIICSRRFAELEWNKIPGRALGILTSGRFLEKQGLIDAFSQWLMEQPIVKFTGYPFELAKRLRDLKGKFRKVPFPMKYTIDMQFKQLVETARQNGSMKRNVWVALDTSGSMGTFVDGLPNISCADIANSLAVFFAELNIGTFHNQIIMFDDKSWPYKFKEEGFCDRIENLPFAWGGTNFQSVIQTIIDIRQQNPSIPLEDYPTTLLVVSDMQFNPVWREHEGGRWVYKGTNFESAKRALKKVFPSDFVDDMKFIWWDCASKRQTYEGTIEDSNVMFLSGFDGSIMPMLLNEEMDENEHKKIMPLEMVKKALSQEILQYVQI